MLIWDVKKWKNSCRFILTISADKIKNIYEFYYFKADYLLILKNVEVLKHYLSGIHYLFHS